jgi:hypothetical protein
MPLNVPTAEGKSERRPLPDHLGHGFDEVISQEFSNLYHIH